MARKAIKEISDEVLQQDLEKYQRKAIELGATDAKIIAVDSIEIDDRVRRKCIQPLCDRYGSNPNCPPFAPDLDAVRRELKNYRYAVLCKLEVPAEKLAGPEAVTKRLDYPYFRKINEIVAKIESEAFHDGYYLAMAFGCGACKGLYCRDVDCSALIPGQSCRFPLKARASMEGVGMDVFGLVTKMGWEIYPLGKSAPSPEIPFGMLVGIVLIY